jgi:hypothetical protein
MERDTQTDRYIHIKSAPQVSSHTIVLELELGDRKLPVTTRTNKLNGHVVIRQISSCFWQINAL